MSRVTTDPAPITLPAPMVTPGRITTFDPIHTSSSMRTGRENCRPPARSSGTVGWPAVEMVTFGAIITRSPIVTVASSTMTRLKFA